MDGGRLDLLDAADLNLHGGSPPLTPWPAQGRPTNPLCLPRLAVTMCLHETRVTTPPGDTCGAAVVPRLSGTALWCQQARPTVTGGRGSGARGGAGHLYAQAEPFTYRRARALFGGTGREVRVNLAVRRTPRPHVTIKYLEPDFTGLFLNGLRGLAPDGVLPDAGVASWPVTSPSAGLPWPRGCACKSSPTRCSMRYPRSRPRARRSRSRSLSPPE